MSKKKFPEIVYVRMFKDDDAEATYPEVAEEPYADWEGEPVAIYRLETIGTIRQEPAEFIGKRQSK